MFHQTHKFTISEAEFKSAAQLMSYMLMISKHSKGEGNQVALSFDGEQWKLSNPESGTVKAQGRSLADLHAELGKNAALFVSKLCGNTTPGNN